MQYSFTGTLWMMPCFWGGAPEGSLQAVPWQGIFVSIAQVIQKNKRGELAELAVITEQVLERHFKDAILVLGEMSMIMEISTILRVYA